RGFAGYWEVPAADDTAINGKWVTGPGAPLFDKLIEALGDLPIIGQAFRYDSSASNRTELLIFLTPRIVLSDLDSELIKQVESERMHFIESDAEELHGPLFSVPEPAEASPVDELPQSFIEPMPQELTPDMANRELLEPDVARAATATRGR
ncbi:MAG: 4-alpha-glucanotransferase, partial [Planctomycetaceae bacterium]